MPRTAPVPILPLLRALLLLLLAGAAAWVAHGRTLRYFGILAPDRVIRVDAFPGLSGIAYWPEKGTLVGVSARGGVAELSLEGKVQRKRIHERQRFEDVALQESTGQALIVDAQDGQLDIVRLADFEIVARSPLPPGGPISALALHGLPPGLAIGRSFPPSLSLYRPDSKAPPLTLLLGSESLAGVLAGPDGEFLLASRENGLMLVKSDGSAVGGWWKPLQASRVTGAALVPGVGLLVCADGDPGRLLVFSSIKNWQDLRHALSS